MKKRIGGAYDRCLKCPYLGTKCDGPNVLAMTLERWCEWCRSLKDLRGYTNAEISQMSGVSQGTIDRVMTGTVSKDIMRSTAADINRTLVGGDGQWPCAMAFEAETPATLKELELKTVELTRLQQMLENIHASYRDELNALRLSESAKVQHLKDEIAHLRAEALRKDAIIDRLLK